MRSKPGFRSHTDPARTRIPSTAWALALLSTVLLLSACGGLVDKTRLRFGGKLRIEVLTHPALNQDFPLAVDFVIAYDKEVYGELKALDASTWFEARDEFQEDFGPRAERRSWEWVPRQTVAPQKVSYRFGAVGGVVFAHYFSPGDHRAVIEPLKGFVLRLGETDFTVEPRKGRNRAANQP